MHLSDCVSKYYPYQEGNIRYNCAEGMLLGINDFYKLNISEDAKTQMKSFGGGMFVGSVCGLLIGAYAALAHLEKAYGFRDNLSLKEVSVLLNDKFEEAFSSINCLDIKPIGGCGSLALVASNLVEELLSNVLI